MSIQVEVWSDFVCRYCYLLSSLLEQFQPTYHFDIDYRAFEIYPKTLTPQKVEQIEAMRPKFEVMARDYYGLEVNAGPSSTNSRLALIGSKIAKAYGVGAEYHHTVMRAFWEQAMPIDDRGVLLDLAESVGLARSTFDHNLDDPAFKMAIAADVSHAHRLKLHTMPSLIINRQHILQGMQPVEDLEALFAELVVTTPVA
jgi:predicted DsbA family dithiol-disulfide isomerase